MGVTGLWQILQPCARPIKIETLNRKRLAVDASIWIYQFLKAVRDKEGNALRNSHVVGFFRRICKLLFFGIKPVFVFDGGAPALKRSTITARKRRREGRRDDAVRTAGKLLAVQMQRQAEQDETKRKEERYRQPEEEVPDEGLVYVDELQMTQQERQQNRKFRKTDAYHLPELDVSMNQMGGPDDPRMMSLEDLESYARQFENGEDINVYDFSKIDYDSPFFMSLPASDRYNILNAARLRSRLRMGHSKEQLEEMFPDRMAFSKFQIERVTERNELTTRLMNINDGDAAFSVGGSSRVAGEKAREYVLVKNEGVEGGWALGVLGGDEGSKQDKAIDVDKPVPVKKAEASDDEDDGFEDVPIEGLNRLPKISKPDGDAEDAVAKQRQAVYKRRRQGVRRKPKKLKQTADPESLFVADASDDEQVEGEWEEIEGDGDMFGDEQPAEEDEELRRAIAMSLDQGPSSPNGTADAPQDGRDDAEEDMLESFEQRAADEARPVPKGSARAIANILNKRANATAPDSREAFSFGVPVSRPEDDDSDDGAMDLQAALAESRRGKRKTTPPPRRQAAAQPTASKTNASGFSGPLPFEKLNLGSSLLGKKKMEKRAEEAEGGFEHPASVEQQRKGEPLPPWFSGNLEEEMEKQRTMEREDREKAKEFDKQFRFDQKGAPALKRYQTGEVIDLEADEEDTGAGGRDKPIDIAGDEPVHVQPEELSGKPVDNEIRMGDMADVVSVQPPIGDEPSHREATPPQVSRAASLSAEEEKVRESLDHQALPLPQARPAPFLEDDSDDEPAPQPTTSAENESRTVKASPAAEQQQDPENDEHLDWSESEAGDGPPPATVEPAGGQRVSPDPRQSLPIEFEEVPAAEPEKAASRSASPDFEDVDMSKPAARPVESPIPDLPGEDDGSPVPAPGSGMVRQETMPDDGDEFDDFSDPEDAEIFKALATEAEEHARFASTLNNKTTAENIADYEKELKQLRNQQKKDRRDADEVTHIMVTECQQLLRLFGLPYVTAPMEAEAQCAELVNLGLVDGIVTDDSDCFLFGGTRVYKNMFNQAKFVECYLNSDLEKEFDLTRDKLIQLAHLLGSDYTEGLPNVGPVSSLEILGEFPDLNEFKQWWSGVQMNVITKEDDKDHPFRKKFRRNATKLFLPSSFPDPRVSTAYHEPEVDSSPQPFQWGVPDLDALRSFLMATIGWSQERTDEVLVPVIRDMNQRADEGTQANITAFFDGGVGVGAAGVNHRGEAFAPRKKVEGSKRMGKALGRMAERAKVQRTLGEAPGGEERGVVMPDAAAAAVAEEQAEEDDQQPVKSGRKRKSGRGAQEVDGDDESGSEFEAPKKKRKGRTQAAGAAAAGKSTKGRKRKAASGEI